MRRRTEFASTRRISGSVKTSNPDGRSGCLPLIPLTLVAAEAAQRTATGPPRERRARSRRDRGSAPAEPVGLTVRAVPPALLLRGRRADDHLRGPQCTAGVIHPAHVHELRPRAAGGLAADPPVAHPLLRLDVEVRAGERLHL